MKKIKAAAAVIAFAISASAWAFMPAPGIWNFANENVGQPGRGFMVEVQNEIVFLTYFGYRADGSSVKYNASGSIVNNTFTSDLLSFVGGPVIAGPIQPATSNGSIGKVTLTFTSGTNGSITLPGDIARPIYKNSFGYAAGPDGLLGTWLLTVTIGTSPFVDLVNLNTKLGASSFGNGVVTTSTRNFGCEFQVSGTLTGMVLCVNTQYVNTDNYLFKFSGDRGDGVDMYGVNLDPYEAHALRISTRTGAETGLNDSTETSLQMMDAVRLTIPGSIFPSDVMTAQAKESADANSISMPHDSATAVALAAWATEVRTLLVPK